MINFRERKSNIAGFWAIHLILVMIRSAFAGLPPCRTPLCNTDLVKRGSFHKDDFIQYLLEIMYGNQCDGICTGCEALEEFVFEGFDYGSMQLNHIIWNNFRGCNSRCVYCTENNSKILESYTAYKIAEDLYQEGFLAENTKIDFGGGEPTMLPNLKDMTIIGGRRSIQAAFCFHRIFTMA